MKKEEVYINLQGKTKEELTDLWEFLMSNGEKPYRDLECFLDYGKETFEHIGFTDEYFCGLGRDGHRDKTEVTIEQLKEILQPMGNKGEQLRKEAKERGYTHDNFKCLIGRLLDGNEDIDKWYYNEFNDILYSNTEMNGGNVVYKNGVWAEKVPESLEQRLEKAEAELNRLKKIIEEKNSIKIGDWVKRTYNGIELFKADGTHDYRHINSEKRVYQKITNPELIKLLEDETN